MQFGPETISSIIVALATCVGVYLLWRTLRATEQTLSEARLTTKAALDGNRVSESIGRRQVRAYVSKKSIELEWIEDRGFTLVSVWLANSGASPALNIKGVALYKDQQVSDGFAHDIAPSHAEGLPFQIPEEVIAQQSKATSNSELIPVQLFWQYDDVFGETHEGVVGIIIDGRANVDGQRSSEPKYFLTTFADATARTKTIKLCRARAKLIN